MLASNPFQGRQRGHEEVLAAAQYVERLDVVDSAPDRILRDRERRAVLLQPDVRIAFVAQVHEVAVVDPLLLQELHRGHGLGAEEDEIAAARDVIVSLRDRVRVVGCPVGRAAPDDAVNVHVGEERQLGVARVHAPHV
jgi:hypothetical protein